MCVVGSVSWSLNRNGTEVLGGAVSGSEFWFEEEVYFSCSDCCVVRSRERS